MSTDLLFIRRLVRDRLGHPMHDDFFTDPLLDANINLAIMAVEEEHRWPWNETSADLVLPAGEKEVSVPDDWRATRAIVQNLNVLGELTLYDLDRLQAGASSAGVPTQFAILYDTIRFAPAGSGSEVTFNHYYYRAPKLLNEDTDIIRLPAQHVGTVVAKACQLCSIREDDRPSAESHMVEYISGLERMRKDVRATTRPAQKRIRPGNWT